MTTLLKQAFDRAAKLPQSTQDELAKQIMDDIESEQQWATAFDSSEEKLNKIAEKALREFKAGKTKPAGFDEL